MKVEIIRTAGVHHVGLTVPDLDAARTFFTEALGFEPVGGKADYPAAFVSDGAVMITLWQAEDPANAAPFDRRRNVGLHHLALRVPDTDALDALHSTLAARRDVSMEFAPEQLGDTPLRHMMCCIPGNIRVEFITA